MNDDRTPTRNRDWNRGRDREHGRGRDREHNRGQTLPDFAVGIAIFLVTVTFVVLFVPQMALPYDGQEGTVVADRASNTIAGDLLVEEPGDNQLDPACTLVFFDVDDPESDHCGFDSTDDIDELLGIGPGYSVNVTLREGPSDGANPAFVVGKVDDGEPIIGESGETLTRGSDIPDEGSVSMARTSIAHGEDRYVLEVGVW